MTVFLAFIIGGIAWRLRGMDFAPNVVGRFGFWGITVGGMIYGFTHNLYYALAGVLLSGLGASFSYFGNDNLAEQEKRTIENYALLTLAGMNRMFYLAAASVFVGMEKQTFLAVIAGALFVPIYLLGLVVWKSRFTEVGEFLFGACVLSALALGFYL